MQRNEQRLIFEENNVRNKCLSKAIHGKISFSHEIIFPVKLPTNFLCYYIPIYLYKDLYWLLSYYCFILSKEILLFQNTEG